jgi:hypothetical protein
MNKLLAADALHHPPQVCSKSPGSLQRNCRVGFSDHPSGYRTSPNEVTSRFMVDPLRRKDLAYVWLSLHSTRPCSELRSEGSCRTRQGLSTDTVLL